MLIIPSSPCFKTILPNYNSGSNCGTRSFTPLNVISLSSQGKDNQLLKVFYLHDTAIPKADHIRYLDVTLDPKLNWNKPIDNVTAKGTPTLGVFRRNVLTYTETVKGTAYK